MKGEGVPLLWLLPPPRIDFERDNIVAIGYQSRSGDFIPAWAFEYAQDGAVTVSGYIIENADLDAIAPNTPLCVLVSRAGGGWMGGYMIYTTFTVTFFEFCRQANYFKARRDGVLATVFASFWRRQ